MRIKTFKSEYFYGGICRVNWDNKILNVDFLDFNSKEILLHKRFPISELLTHARFYIELNGSYYYADKITSYINSKL